MPSRAEPKVARAVTGRRVGLQRPTAWASVYSGREPWAQASASVAYIKTLVVQVGSVRVIRVVQVQVGLTHCLSDICLLLVL